MRMKCTSHVHFMSVVDIALIFCAFGGKGLGVLFGFAYNFCLCCVDSGGFFATEEKEGKRGKKRKDLKS